MLFKEIQDEVISIRFKEGQRNSVKHWINTRMQQVWSFADWPFKNIGPVPLVILAGNDTPVLPADFHRPVEMFDDAGFVLPIIEPSEFSAVFLGMELDGSHAQPGAAMWRDDQIIVGPVPDADYTYNLVYERRITHLESSRTIEVLGLMDGDADEPIWDSDYHYMLVHGAVATGLKLENDPTWQPIEEEFLSTLAQMRDHYLPSNFASSRVQFGRDTLGLE